ncbi:MAG: HAMP domain-containing histidine kinase [Proteobacteria bacterium]|nr:HAMP domain-containing histidine kinase [Pseudomonadota bacterium]
MIRAPRSILFRIVSLHVAALAAASLLIPLTVVTLLNATVTAYERDALHRHEAEIARAAKFEAGRWRLDLPADLQALYAHGYAGFAYAVLDDRGAVLFSSLPSGASIRQPDPWRPKPRFFRHERQGAVFHGGLFHERIAGRRLWIEVTQNLSDPDVVVDDIATAFLKRIGWLVLPILLALLALDFYIVRRALKPVLEASQQAGSLGPDTLSVRLSSEGMPSEIEPLVRAVNAALDRIEQGYMRQRAFTADVAHELRTPLSILRMRVEDLSDADAARPLLADIDAMTRVVGQLLEMAELETVVLDPDQRADLHALGEEVAAYMAPFALSQRKHVALTGTGAPVWVQGDKPRLFRALRNLIENAIAHTPVGGTVELVVMAPGEIRVLDEGPGVAPGERELMFRRRWRRDRSKGDGAGLGLSIVARIVEAHGGAVSVENRPEGGAAFTVSLIPAPEPSAAGVVEQGHADERGQGDQPDRA